MEHTPGYSTTRAAHRRIKNQPKEGGQKQDNPASVDDLNIKMASQADDNPDTSAEQQSKPPLSPTSPTSLTDKNAATAAAAARLHRPIMQSLPDTRQQSFDEIYGPPENFLEIEVRYQ